MNRLRHYQDYPSINILKPREQVIGQDGSVSMKQLIDTQNEQHYENKNQNPNYRYQQKVTEENFEMINVGQIQYDKKIAIIINPNAGKKGYLEKRQQMISKKLNDACIQHEYLVTKGRGDVINFTKNLDIDNYSAIVSVGGDGTCHEMINGMMLRPDKKKIPLGFLPGGTGNDFCSNFQNESFETGLDYLVKGNLIKTDIFKVLLDYNSEEELRNKAKTNNEIEISNHLRYSIVNNSFLLVGLTAKNAVPMKPYMGQTAYTVSCVRELIRRVSCTYDLIFDNGLHKEENLWTQYL